MTLQAPDLNPSGASSSHWQLLYDAAPDMARALQMVLSCFAPDDDDATVRAVKAALAKAGL